MFGILGPAVAHAQEAAPPGSNSMFTMILMFGMIALVWWFIMFRPQQKREKERQAMLAALRKGDNVVTAGGIHARIHAVEDAVVTLEIGKDVRFKCDKSAIVGVPGAGGEDKSTDDSKK
mgnify:CR=1 FL=1